MPECLSPWWVLDRLPSVLVNNNSIACVSAELRVDPSCDRERTTPRFPGWRDRQDTWHFCRDEQEDLYRLVYLNCTSLGWSYLCLLPKTLCFKFKAHSSCRLSAQIRKVIWVTFYFCCKYLYSIFMCVKSRYCFKNSETNPLDVQFQLVSNKSHNFPLS